MDPWRRFGWPLAGLAFVAAFCVAMRISLETGAEAPSPEDQSLDLVKAPEADSAPASALVPPRLPDLSSHDGWGEDRVWSGTSYRAAVQAVPRNLKDLPGEAQEPAREIMPPAPKARRRGAQAGPMATVLASTATKGLVGALVRSLTGGT